MKKDITRMDVNIEIMGDRVEYKIITQIDRKLSICTL